MEMPEEVNIDPYCAAERLSELTSIKVTTSRGLLSIQLLICASHADRRPASRSVQLLWHRRIVLLERWTCAERRRTPAERATVAL